MTDLPPDAPSDEEAPSPDAYPPADPGIAQLGITAAPDVDERGDRIPPHDLLAEQSALGGMMLNPSVVDDVTEHIRPGAFYDPRHELIADAIVALHRGGHPCDVIAVTAELEARGHIRRAGGAEYLHTLTGAVPTAANAGYYADIVAKKAILRGLVEAGTRVVQMGFASEGEPADLVQTAITEVTALTGMQKLPLRRIDQGLRDIIVDLGSPPDFLPSPWWQLDQCIGGFAPGDLYVVAARSSGGKSIAVLQAALSLAQHGAVAFSSLEMTTEELQQRILAMLGDIEMSTIRKHKMSNQDDRSAVLALTRLEGRDGRGTQLYIDDTPAASINHIRNHARAVAREGKLAAVVVDYLQIVEATGETRELAVSGIAWQLKQMAKELQVPVIVAAQLGFAQTFRGRTPAPTVADLRESRAVINHADGVILMHRSKDDVDKGLITFAIGKNRHGEAGIEFQMVWEGRFSRITDQYSRRTTSSPLFGTDPFA